MPLSIAIVGRPNVGKSTLFNRLAGSKRAIVDNTPGVTRDWIVALNNVAGLELRLIDTAGFEKSPPETLQARMLAQTEAAIEEADICLFLIDAREGVTPGDEIVGEALRKSGKPVILAANKCEGRAAEPGLMEAFALGFDEPIALSAEHGIGFAELVAALAPYATENEKGDFENDGEDKDEEYEDERHTLRLAIVGRPNVGKSSLLNRILGQNRSLVGPEAGITRDAVLAEWQFEGRGILLHDTAGLRKKARVTGRIEKMSVDSTLNAIRFADCVVLVMDATQTLERQDLSIADMTAREGRALIIAVNKWDLIEDRQGALKILREEIDRLLPQIFGAELVALSALTGEGMERLMPAVMQADRIWNTRLPTSTLNRFLEHALERHPPPAIRGRRIRIRYMTQAKARPPTFVLFGNQLSALPETYLRYLTNGLRSKFKLLGTPIRFNTRSSKNPFSNK
ncbi:MAG: ribosome biogenesis GTPase Der [Micropepsaceae bacterium]